MSVYGSITYESDIEFINWLCEDIDIIEEGANIDMLKEFMSMKKEYKAEIKVFRQAIKDKDKEAAEKSKNNLSKIVGNFKDYCKANRKAIEDGGLIITVLNFAKGFVVSFLFTFCTKKAIELYAKNKNASIEWKRQNLLDKIAGTQSFLINTNGIKSNDEISTRKARYKAQDDISKFTDLMSSVIKGINIGFLLKGVFDGSKMNDYKTTNSLYMKLMQATERLEKEISNLKLDFLE